MSEQKMAFLAGVSRRCKEAKMDADDSEQVAELLLMPKEKAAYIIGQIMWDRREQLTKEAGAALIKLADSGNKPLDYNSTVQPDIEEDPNYVTPGSGRPNTTPAPAPTPEPPATPPADTSPPPQPAETETSAPVGEAEDTQKTDASNTTSPGVISLDDPMSDQETQEMADFQPITLEDFNQETQRNQNQNLQDQAIARGFNQTVTPFMEEQGVTGDWLQKLQQQGINTKLNRQHMRNIQKAYGWNFMPIRGGLRAGDIDPSKVTDPMRRKSLEVMKNYLANRESDASAVGGMRQGWSTFGSSFKGGGERALRGRQPTKPSATEQAAAAGRAAAGGGAAPAGGQTMGQANRARIPQLQAQNKAWSIRDANGNVVRSGSWGQSQAPQTAAAPAAAEPTQAEAEAAQGADPFAAKAQAAEESMMPDIIAEQQKSSGDAIAGTAPESGHEYAQQAHDRVKAFQESDEMKKLREESNRRLAGG